MNIRDRIIAHNNEFDVGDIINCFLSDGTEVEGKLVKVLDVVYGLVELPWGTFKTVLSGATIIKKRVNENVDSTEGSEGF